MNVRPKRICIPQKAWINESEGLVCHPNDRALLASTFNFGFYEGII